MQKLNAVKLFVLINAVLIGFQGIVHGITGILKGDTPTGGMLLESIGAITLIQNYLYTGIAATLAGLAIILWAVFFMRSGFFTPVFFVLGLALLFTGGGVGFVVFFLFALAASTQRNTHFKWLSGLLKGKAGDAMAKAWKALFVFSFSCVAAGIGIWLFVIPPGVVHEINAMQYTCWAFLLLGVAGLIPSAIAAVAADMRGDKAAG